ncbi:MAG: CRTAC1 family protein [Flavobacteriaceae bacterium]|tara:strand:- start:1626 stop:3320 length:1695 start_codon:yes stop_codon:yes gene_type:complete
MKDFLFITLFLPFLFSGQNVFSDVTSDAGIDNIYDVYQGLFGGGVVAFDYNNDGYEDLFITGGQGQDVLYKNNGNGTFTDVTKESGLFKDRVIVTTGVSSADINKDGYIDLFLTTIASQLDKSKKNKTLSPNLLYINNGNGTFSDQSSKFRIIKNTFSTSSSFGDINADGFPDLFVGNYFKNFYFEESPFNTHNLAILNHYSINEEYETGDDELYINVEGKYFKDASDLLIDAGKGYGFGGVFTDFDNDNDLDLFIINDFGETSESNRLLVNQYPELRFENKSRELKINFGLKSMGVGVGDYNNDTFLDYHVTNIFAGPFIVNRGEGLPFINLMNNVGTGVNKIKSFNNYEAVIIGWGSLFLDYDNDTDLDLFNSNGPINPLVNPIPNILFENKGRVYELNENSGVMDYGIARGSVHFDYDNDGDQDIFVVNQRPVHDMSYRGGIVGSKLYRNDSPNENNWLKIKLKGNQSTTRGLGSRIRIVCDDLNMIREVDGGSSHASQNTSIVHFGVGENKKIDSLIISWPGGKKQHLTDILPNQLIEIEELYLEEPSFLDSIMKYFNWN